MSHPVMPPRQSEGYTIGALARSAGVGVETIRYYQRRGLLPVPAAGGGVRRYPVHLAQRVRFIRRAQTLGFHLQEIATLLHLDACDDRASIRQVARERLHEVQARLRDLQHMEQALTDLIDACACHPGETRCPIIQGLWEVPDGASLGLS